MASPSFIILEPLFRYVISLFLKGFLRLEVQTLQLLQIWLHSVPVTTGSPDKPNKQLHFSTCTWTGPQMLVPRTSPTDSLNEISQISVAFLTAMLNMN